ncbi:MAG: zinc ribbon domain-containing protein [Oscillospiraceae bacterium]|nr:zinc ribbon domain-containing protein [Oscillospiraceae bacterium]
MICSNCSSEITDSAKFCPECGQKCAPAPLFCTNCGLELKAGSKFCSVCGTPVGAKETKPESMGYAGNVDAPASASESLVAAMPSTAPAAAPTPAENAIPAGIPTPVDSAPTASGFGVPTPVNDTANAITAPVTATAPVSASVFAAVPSQDSAQKVDLAKPGTQPATADFGDMGFSSATAVAVTPIKKRNGGKIAIIIGATVVAIAAIMAIVFFINKGPIMNALMGNSRYASMIEGNGLKNVAEYANNPVIAQGIKSASASYAAAAAVNLHEDTDYAAHTIMTHNSDPMSQFATMLEQYEKAMLDTYGVNSVSVKLDTDVTLTDTARALLFGSLDDEVMAEFDKALEAINSTTLTYDITAEKDAAMFGLEMTEGGLTVNAQAFMLSDGTVYVCFPFGSDKAIKYVMKDGEVVYAEETPELELDDKEISRLIGEIIDIYLKYYENSDIEITSDGELYASDARAHGTLITATMNNGLIEDMFAEIGRHIADDTYFSGKIIEYVEECGMELTLDEYREDIIYAFDINVSEGYSIIVKSVVDKNNNVLGKRYELNFANSEEFEYSGMYSSTQSSVFGYVESKDVLAAEFGHRSTWGFEDNTYDSEFNVSALVRKTSETDGSVSLKLRADEESYAANIEYSGVKTEKFLGNDVTVGTYTLTVTPPADFTEDISSEDAAVLTALSASKFTLSSKLDGDAYACSIKMEIPQYGSIALNTSVSSSDGKVTVPSGDVIEISDTLADYLTSYYFMYGYSGYDKELSEADKAAMEEISALFGALKDKVASSDSWYAQYVAEALGESSKMFSNVPVPNASTDDISALMERVYEDISAVSSIYSHPNISESLKSRCDDLNGDLYDLYYEMGYTMTQEELEGFTAQLEKLEDTISALEKEAKETPITGVTPNGGTSYDFDSMGYEELMTAYYDISGDCAMAILSSGYDLEDDEIVKLLEKLETAGTEAMNSLNRITDSLNDGSLSVPLLRDARKKMKALEEASNAFISAVTTAQ